MAYKGKTKQKKRFDPFADYKKELRKDPKYCRDEQLENHRNYRFKAEVNEMYHSDAIAALKNRETPLTKQEKQNIFKKSSNKIRKKYYMELI